jgi:hypothetical protein
VALTRRTLLAVGGLAVVDPVAAEPAASGAPLYVPAGCRLGIRKPAELEPLAGDARNLLSPDHTFRVHFWEPPAFGGAEDGDVWNHRPDRVTLLSEQTVSAGEQRRLFEMSDFAGDANHSWFTLVVRTIDARGRPDWFGRLFLITKPMARSTSERARWRETIEALVASVTVRPALSVAEMLAEHRITMDLTGLHPHHFGNKLVVSMVPPSTAAGRWTNNCHISMPKPPVELPSSWDGNGASKEARQFAASLRKSLRPWTKFGPIKEWISNGILWLAEPEHPISGTNLHVRGVKGYGPRRMIEFTSHCSRSDRAEIGAALERIARSVVLLP